MLIFRRIVAATDFSRHGDLALESALALAKACKSELYVLHIVFPQIYQSEMPEMMMPPVEDISTDLLEIARRHMQTWQQGVPPGINVQTHVVESGSKEDVAICKFADDVEADLIIVGSHGRTGLMHLILGSNAEHVVRHAKCPVLVVKPKVPFT